MNNHNVIAIGGSLGAIEAIGRICRELPADLNAAVLVVIHVGAEGRNLLAGIFDADSKLTVKTAADGDPLEPGHVYVAPADHHLLVIDGEVRLGRGPRENMARPAIDPLFRSVALSFGPRAIAVVLTGMLNDGAAGLAAVKRCGGITVVQNPADALAADMPWGALRASDVDYRAPISDMAELLVKLVGEQAGPLTELSSDIQHDIRSEVDIALGRRSDTEIIRKLADPVALSCPACGGVLSQIKRSPPLRFRCQVGHAYTAEALETEKESVLDEAVRVALRIIEERIVLTGKIADDARRSGRASAAASYDQRLEETRAYAEILRQAVAEQ